MEIMVSVDRKKGYVCKLIVGNMEELPRGRDYDISNVSEWMEPREYPC